MFYKAKEQSGRGKSVLIVLIGAIAAFGLSYSIFRTKTPSDSREAREAAPLEPYSDVSEMPQAQADKSISLGVQNQESLAAGSDASRPQGAHTGGKESLSRSPDSRAATDASRIQDWRHSPQRRFKVIAHIKPDESANESADNKVKDITMYEDLVAESLQPPGYRDGDTRGISIPESCEYVAHQLTLAERRPWNPIEVTGDLFTSYLIAINEDSSGRVRHIVLSVGATARKENPAGSLIKMRLSVDVHCKDGYAGRIDSFSE